MSFPFNPRKAAQSAALFLQLGGGAMDILKLVKLLYLAERKSFEDREVPIFGGNYYSLPHGPIVSEGLDLMNRKGIDRQQTEWNKLIHPRNENSIEVIECETDDLSPEEIAIIGCIHEQHGGKTPPQIRNWCHKNVPEYKEVQTGHIRITLGEMTKAVGANSTHVREELQAANFFADVFA